MDTPSLNLLGAFQAGCSLVLILSFLFWFRLRETPSGDLTCLIVSTACAAFLFLSTQMLKGFGCFGVILAAPGFVFYLWLLGLRGSRRQDVRIRQWGRRHGYRVVTIERQYDASRSASSSAPGYRILARRLSDGQVLVGEVYVGPTGFRVHWIPVPPKHLPHGHPPEVPNPPHAGPPPPS